MWAARPGTFLAVYVHNKGLTRIFRGPHARNTPHQRPLRPKRRPPRPQHPIFSIFHRSGLCFGRCTTPSRNLAATNRGEITPSKPPTRRRHAARRLRMAQNPPSPPAWRAPRNTGPGCCARVGGRAWPGFETTHRSATQPHWCGECQQDLTAVPEGGGGTCRGAGGRRQGLAGLRADAPNLSAHQEPLAWRAPEGPAAVPVGGGRDWPGFETTRRAKLAARKARGRAAAHRHTQRPGPQSTRGARNTRGATQLRSTTTTAPTTKRGRDRFPGRGLVTQSAPLTEAAAPPAIRRSCPRDPRPRRGQPRGGRRGRGTGSRTRSRRPRCGRSGSTAGRHRARHTRRA